jgi:hypothetical protein
LPDFGYQSLGALLILLPGFLTAELVRTLATRAQRTEFEKVVQAFIYSFLVYVCFTGLNGKFPVSIRAESIAGSQHYTIEPHFWPLVELLLIATILGFVLAALMNKDVPFSVLRRWGWTQRTFRVSVWNDTFHTFSGYVEVCLADGRYIVGWLRFYSDTADEASLFLEDAAWVNEDGTQLAIPGPGILLTKETGVRSVMFLNAERSKLPITYQS